MSNTLFQGIFDTDMTSVISISNFYYAWDVPL